MPDTSRDRPAPRVVIAQQALSQVERAHLDNAAAWRNTAALCAILLITVVLAWAIPIAIAVTAVRNSRATQAAIDGVYTRRRTGQERREAQLWVLGAFLVALGALMLVATQLAIGYLVGAILVLAGLACIWSARAFENGR